ncbi:helix-turn-helix transcriptional regulator [Sphingomonas sp. LB2R24]|uniref:helix-turn-helix domain-containing protein n=1 Tax=Sphingomonas sorbitolis TaxID=3096165 RepID=UPI002FCB5C26
MTTRLYLEEIIQPAALDFGARVKARRKALGLTQTDIYTRTDIAIGYLSTIERGRANPTLDLMVKLSAALEMQIWDLLRPDEQAENTPP